ncbi:MAG: O-antigen ligase family protein [Roseburia sp.]|nr:O-antigen ligase family protein [Roseburia sp.]
MKKDMSIAKKNIIGAVLLVFVLSVVPLIVSAYHYEVKLNSYPWFSGSTTYDFFLYWKGQALLFLCGMIALYAAVKAGITRKEIFGQTDRKYLIPLAVYFVMCLLSALFSEHRNMAIWGGYEQWEGMLIIGAYVFVCLAACGLVKGETETAVIRYGLLAGVLVLSFLSVRQFMGEDFFRTPLGNKVMNFMSEKKLNFTFNFEKGRVYATLYNPNYVGSYVALVLPVVLSLVSFKKKVGAALRSLVAVLAAVWLMIMLAGSESVTGCIGIIASLLLFAVFMITNIKKHPVCAAVISVLCVGVFAGIVFTNKPVFEYGINKIKNPTPNHFFVKSMVSKEGLLYITTKDDDVLRLNVYIENGSYMYEAADEDGKAAGIYRDAETSRMKFTDERFQEIEIYEKGIRADEKDYDAFVVATPSENKEYTVVLTTTNYEAAGLHQTVYKMYNPFGKIDDLREIKRIGFEDNQHFGSRRGYIWSRTFPLLGERLLLGSGPNTFVYEFPNDDYVGMRNVGYDGATVTKPHNMYMQIFVQTGLLSLLAFLALYLFYFVECVRLYMKKTEYSAMEITGIGILLGTFGYLVTGLANDSTVAVAPLYWCLLGVGIAVNRYNRKIGETEN